MRLYEFTPSRTQFSQILADTSLRMGFECEVLLPEESYDNEGETEIDWEAERDRINAMDYGDIEYSLTFRQEQRIQRAYREWVSDQLEERWDEVADRVVREYCIDHDLLGKGEDTESVLEDDDNIEEAKEEWMEQNNDYDMDQFITDNYSSMSRFCSDFDIEIEPNESSYIYPSSNVESVHENWASDLGDAIGEHVLVGHGGAEDWHVEQDSSIGGDGTGMEIISPVFSISDGLNALQKVFNWIIERRRRTRVLDCMSVSVSKEKAKRTMIISK